MCTTVHHQMALPLAGSGLMGVMVGTVFAAGEVKSKSSGTLFTIDEVGYRPTPNHCCVL